MDRNYAQAQLVNGVQKSLSARRAWIEISFVDSFVDTWTVALRKESVDRNYAQAQLVNGVQSRSPQGERG